MKTIPYTFILFGVLAILAACSPVTSNDAQMKDCELADLEIQHMVIFNLPYAEGSVEAEKFLEDGTRILTAIPVVKNFQAFHQVSEKNDYQYGFSMVFSTIFPIDCAGLS